MRDDEIRTNTQKERLLSLLSVHEYTTVDSHRSLFLPTITAHTRECTGGAPEGIRQHTHTYTRAFISPYPHGRRVPSC